MKVDTVRGLKGCYEAANKDERLGFTRLLIQQTGRDSAQPEYACEARGFGYGCGANIVFYNSLGEVLMKRSGSLNGQVNEGPGFAAIFTYDESDRFNTAKYLALFIDQVEYDAMKFVKAMTLIGEKGIPPITFQRCLGGDI